jgi:hypothetical protein
MPASGHKPTLASALDSPQRDSYMAAIPFHRLTGGAFVRAPFFR